MSQKMHQELFSVKVNPLQHDKISDINYPLPDDKILGSPKLKVFADNKQNVSQKI